MSAIDKIIHEQARLRIITFLAASEQSRVSFNQVQEKLGFSSGNLSVQLRKLADAGYVQIEKTFKDNKPFTTVSIIADGTRALQEYVKEMENIINSLRQ
jgi:DNA-binding transcriptional ArsR family regulator